MKILKNVLNEIIRSIPEVPPETGGIMGGENNVVSRFVFDNGCERSNGYDVYAPDTELLNQVIRQWSNENIELYGIFHSHFPGGTDLSDGDRKYISQIMSVLSPQITILYFPIVLPREKMLVYRADRENGQVHIASDDIEII